MISTTQFTHSQEPTVPTHDNLIKVLCSVEDLSFTDIMGWYDPKMHTPDKQKLARAPTIWKTRLFEENA